MMNNFFSVQYYNNETVANCPKPCHYVQYDVSVSQSHFPNVRMLDWLKIMFDQDKEFFE